MISSFTHRPARRWGLFVAFAVVAVWPSEAALRVVSYNTYGARPEQKTVFEAIGNKSINGIARPIDVLILQEQTYNHSSEATLVSYLNDLYGPGVYAYGDFDIPYQNDFFFVGIIFNTTTVDVNEAVFGKYSGSTRFSGRYRVHPLGYDGSADVYIYNTHYKSGPSESDKFERAKEAIEIRWNTAFGSDFLDANANVIYAGDYNMYMYNEDADMNSYDFTDIYGRVYVDNPYFYLRWGQAPWAGTTGYGEGVDPIDRPGFWHDGIAFTDIHTQCPGIIGAGGGMDDRFDMQLVCTELYDGEGLSYIGPGVGDCNAATHSYLAFGNDGSHILNDLITTGTGAEPNVLEALAEASDHLPVVADYQLPAKMGVSVDANIICPVLQYEQVLIQIPVENTAPALAPVGADELDYQISVTGGTLIDSDTGTDEPLGGANIHQVALDTNSPGSCVLEITVVSDSQSVVDGTYNETVQYTVVETMSDLNGDGFVDSNDLSLFTAAWLSEPNDTNWNPCCDFIIDGSIDFIDYAHFSEHWNK